MLRSLIEDLNYSVYYFYSSHQQKVTQEQCITLDFLGIPMERDAEYRHLTAGLERPLLQYGVLRQYIRCHSASGVVRGDVQFACHEASEIRRFLGPRQHACRCREGKVDGIMKCDAVPLIAGENYTHDLPVIRENQTGYNSDARPAHLRRSPMVVGVVTSAA